MLDQTALANQLRAIHEDVMNGFAIVRENLKVVHDRLDRMESDIREIRDFVGMGKSRH